MMGRATSVVVFVLLAFRAQPQSSAEVNAGIQFNFASPGARSLARGGAFIADASDATAAHANPAGLVNLPAREASIETRFSEFVNSYSDRGHALGPPTGRGTDTLDGIETGRAANRVNNVSFGSVVVPRRRFAVATYWHELSNFAASARTQGVFFDSVDRETNIRGTYRQFAAISSLRLRIAGGGIAGGWRVTDRLSLGIGVRRYRSDLLSSTERYQAPLEFYGPADYTRRDNLQTQQGSGTSYGVNAGILFDLHEKVSIGASYRQGFSFPVTVTYVDYVDDVPRPRPPKTSRFNVPSFYGTGISVRPTDDWSILLDVNRITYSDTTRGFVLLFEDEPRYFVPDGTEVRLGTEIVLTRDRGGVFARLPAPLAVSAGVWRDPDHSIRVDDLRDSQSVLFRPTSDDIHVTFGLGMIFTTRAQVHAAVDRSSRQTVVSVSAMARF